MHAQKKKKVFLLGGGDLEMKTIKDILKKSSDYVMVDKDLKWDDALLSKYEDELVQYSSDDYKIYGIELRADITVPKNYIRIDHHNDLQNMPSALEQIGKIIQHELTDEEKLIVANDKGYYPGMKEYLDKTYPEMTEEDKKCMMYEIRKRDRAAQGVTEEQEEKAKEFYMYSENTDFATFVQVNKDIPFSPIADALWSYERLVINNKEKTNLFDAVISQPNESGQILDKDTLAPHGGKKHDDPFAEPVPIPFIKIASGVQLAFRFRLKETKDKTGEVIMSKDDKKNLFKQILETYGVGAKTNVGYGLLKYVEGI